MEQRVPYTWKPVLAGGLLTLLAGMGLFIFGGRVEWLLLPFAYLYLLVLAYDWKAAYWILLCSLPFSMHIELDGGVLSTSIPDEPMIWLFFLLFLLLLAYRPNSIPGWFLRHPITILISLQFLWLLVSVLCSQLFFPAAKFFIAKSWYLVCFYVFPVWIFKDKRDIKTVFWVLLLPVFVTIAVITWRHSTHDYSFLSVNHAIGKLYYNHVEYGAILSMLFPVLVVAFLLSGKKVLWRIVGFLAVAAFSVVLFLTYARAAVLGVAFAAVVAACIRFRLVNWVMPAMYLCIAAIVIFFAHDNMYMEFTPDYEHTYMRHNLSDHIRATFQGQDMSSMERVYRWVAAVRMSTEHPLTGFGPHGFIEHYKTYTVPAFRTYVSDNPERSTTHNYFLLMLTEQGWPAMLLYAILTPLAFAQAQSTYHRFKDRFYKLCTLALAMLLAACFINNFFSELIETHKVGALLYLSLSLLAVLSNKSRQTDIA
ncbi:O-antigen ligase family protein [Polluticoccus soli]|uniref:O-antigen ligase family protein n=1 Tax=Polluticoccus soli TaxID=3034150 RepID=UPI0023E1ACF0|nr:O-antigen ligase family protein [Flavipsychrobacter sp. JY13-12]